MKIDPWIEDITRMIEYVRSGRSPNARSWLYSCGAKVYIRVGRRYFDAVDGVPQPRFTVDIGAVDLGRYAGRGEFDRFRVRLEKLCDANAAYLYVENVQTQRFRDYFIRNGYAVEDSTHSMSTNLYRRPRQQALARSP